MKPRFALVGAGVAAGVAALGVAGWLSLAPAEVPPPSGVSPRSAAPGPEAAPQVLTAPTNLPPTNLPPAPGLAEAEADLPPPSARDDMEAGRSLVERGAELFLRGLLDEVGPQLDEMQKGLGEAARTLGPKLSEMMALIDDLRHYQAPERLPNGDVILRRLPGAPPPPPLPDADGGPDRGPDRGPDGGTGSGPPIDL